MSFLSLLCYSCCFFFSSTALSIQTILLTPISKDPSTLQYTTTVYHKTPLKPTKLLLDLGASFCWIDCEKNYKSLTYHPIPCKTSLCASLNSSACSNCYNAPGPDCANNTCALFPENPVTRKAALANALRDSLALSTTDGRNPGRLAIIPDFVFSCARTTLLKGLANGVTGLAALGRSSFSLSAQISTAMSSPFLFTLCLSGSPSAPGVAFFGTRGPYFFLPDAELSKSLVYTPLLVNPVGNTVITYSGQPSDEYFIGVTAVNVNGKAVRLNETLLAIDQNGNGGTKISTVVPYTTMESSIYKAFTEAFSREAAAVNLTVTKPVKPFNVCFQSEDVSSTRVGPAVPVVDLVMESEDVFWRIFGANSMVRIVGEDEDVWCLGFVDGGANARTGIVIGGYQMEDNLVEFDLGLKRFGFSSSVLIQQTSCANFNFTTNNKIAF
ncbi:hypothetical protein HHK36_012587 [Tetracentron sinense]|uniref:Peptidase A1 domain-containing protein n=1 Tax=Tetracentron sinense TaxID=13715 RepID=A0A835DFT9_TETSI|nr:hypothetical protein HHK36_012587 [Tetracentron sinense]